MARRVDNLTALDWDDSALIRAYNKGMSLRAKDFESKERRQGSKKKEWKVGNYCQAVYPGDDLMYEAKIVSVSDETCVVDFLGYDEEAEVDIDNLSESKGKRARKRQIRRVIRMLKEGHQAASADESAASGDDMGQSRNSYSPACAKKKADYTTADSTFQTIYPTPAHCNTVQPPAMMVPGVPPMPHCSDLSQNSSLTAMMTSWYMAGYYTALHQVQKKNQRCCCQNCCHH